ncbi:MAG TPA: adenylate/guanylate cyclase domain-containing protein, partial [Thermomicrobiales bacterium]|nr:adenylate/guanylate cyclase domain-containing protein [Thermomicrobiales bacterium]
MEKSPMRPLPAGEVTLLFTDIEGSTRRWEARPAAMAPALRTHDLVLRAAIEGHGGAVFKTVGDAFCAAFADAGEALAAALAAQRGLAREAWGELGPLRVRMALHTGAA